jgi:hypothetical protein
VCTGGGCSAPGSGFRLLSGHQIPPYFSVPTPHLGCPGWVGPLWSEASCNRCLFWRVERLYQQALTCHFTFVWRTGGLLRRRSNCCLLFIWSDSGCGRSLSSPGSATYRGPSTLPNSCTALGPVPSLSSAALVLIRLLTALLASA